jgi:23S rRNA (uracil1939-C5)-methyltransferase
MQEAQGIRKGGEVVLPIEKLAFGGKGITRLDGFVVFTDRALPGQKVLARVTRKRRQYAEARVIEILSQSPHVVEPFCPHFGICGGCTWQDLAYEQQLHWKRRHVLESLEHLAGIEEALVEPTMPSHQTQWYRNKMEYTFSARRWLLPQEIASKDTPYNKSFALGLHVRGCFDRVFDVETCFLQSPLSVQILRETREWCKKSGLPAYSIGNHEGLWRFLVIREGKHTQQTLVHILTSDQFDHERAVNGLAGHLIGLFPQITTLVHSVSRKKAQVAFGDSSRNIVGPGFIEERFGSLRFRISAHSFFQTNPHGAEKLYETVNHFGEFTGKETVWDLYCGTGSIALFIASQVRRIVGFEVVEDAIKDAYDNCRLNDIGNCSFHAGDLKDVIKGMEGGTGHGGAPDVVITDPPRSGMHPHVVKALMELAPRRIIAVSCNPATLARDLAVLLDLYEIQKVQPFDLFPHTPHIECVVKLEKKR